MHLPALNDTIVAVSSAWNAAMLGIVRLSGPSAFALLEQLGVCPPRPSRTSACWTDARLRISDRLTLPATIYWFRQPRSYTGQDVAEIHCPGALPALRAVASRLISAGARRALPGEFTARAFLNRRLNADQVEGVLELIESTDETAARLAARLACGTRAAKINEISERLLDLAACVEAGIDFVDEEDVSFIDAGELLDTLDGLLREASDLRGTPRELQRADKPHVALAGLPNAGKSTLFNALLGQERAIVTPVLGTTRDVLSAETNLDGISIVLQDTAGIGPGEDELEAAAHLAAERAADHADLVIWVHDCTLPWEQRETYVCGRIPENRRVLVLSKHDKPACVAVPHETVRFGEIVEISATDGHGLPVLRETLAERLSRLRDCADVGTADGCIESACEALRQAREVVSMSCQAVLAPELVALELREALEFLGAIERITSTSDEILGRIFSRFCIGK